MNDMTHEDFNIEFENIIVTSIYDRWVDYFYGGESSGGVNYTMKEDENHTFDITMAFDFKTKEWWGGVSITGYVGEYGGGLLPSVYEKPGDAIDAIKDRIWELISEAKNNK